MASAIVHFNINEELWSEEQKYYFLVFYFGFVFFQINMMFSFVPLSLLVQKIVWRSKL